MASNVTGRERRKLRIRKRISGNEERPRLSVFRSNVHIYAQVVDDVQGKTLASASTLSKEIKGKGGELDKTAEAKAVGKLLGELCKKKGIEKVVFDRNGYIYHGRIKALADAAREAGLSF
ncbi:MAG: 50S ribosomal protein L18 [Myxococcales bacterium]|nr:50S ribosomal protein L18 [Myxococcales bacterium]MBL8721403.1 50S ribosomal protein L18 [Myxococcales bacterium]